MLVLALEFSRDVPARGARPTATDNRGETGAYGASGRRGRTEAASPEGTQGSFPQNGRARPGSPGRLDPVTDGLPAVELTRRSTNPPLGGGRRSANVGG